MRLQPLTILLAVVSGTTYVAASVEPLPIPRSPTQFFRSDGSFEGGTQTRANLETMRVAEHAQDGFERWVFDFSDAKSRVVGGIAPRFQVHYHKADKSSLPDGKYLVRQPARFRFLFRTIKQNFVTRETIRRLVKKSRFVERVLVYPAIEDGDMAVEFTLRGDVRFEPHQPLEKEGRLVLDLREAEPIS